jgi:acetyl-CoA synthetase
MTPYQRFIEARDFLQQHRTDYELAYRGYMAPALTTFNWALDYFDVQAQGNQTPALWVVGEDGASSRSPIARCRPARTGWRTTCANAASNAATGCC